MIAYRHDGLQPFKIAVKLDGRIVGNIRRNPDGLYFYQPRGNGPAGAFFRSVEAVKRSIEGSE
jgi:hypothetical protein